jgi:hypothetical protein
MIVQEVFSKINELNQEIQANKNWLRHYEHLDINHGVTPRTITSIKRKTEIKQIEVGRLMNLEIKE